jgi:glycosyltransferase involved in cell wall biosynthesis
MNQELPLVSVVIPNFNNSKYIIKSIESVFAQTYKNIEIILVDDGSTDSSLETLKPFENQIKVIASDNNGAASARNVGINSANGSVIAFLDSDDIWDSSKIEKQIIKLLGDNLDLVYCSGIEFGLSAKQPKLHQAKFSGACYRYFSDFPTVAVITLGCSTAVVRREVIEKSGLFDENFKGPAEDWDFFRRVCKFANVGFVDEDLVRYRIHDRNVSRSSALNYFDGNKMAIKKMLSEDSSIHRANVWHRFYLVFMKESIKTRNIGLLRRTIASLFRVID